MVVTDAEPDQLAPLAPPAPLGLRGVWVVQRAVAPTAWRGVLTCPRASVRGASSRAPPPKSGPRLPLARALLVTGRERIPSRRECWGCCDGRTGPRSPPSWNPPAGSRTRCGGSLPAWCARSSGSSLPPRRPTATVSTGLLAASLKPSSLIPPPPSRAPDHAAALARAGRDRGRDRSHPFAPARCAAAAVAAGVRTSAPCRSEQGPAGSHGCRAPCRSELLAVLIATA